MTRYKPTGAPRGRRKLPHDEQLVTSTCRIRRPMQAAIRLAAAASGLTEQDWKRRAFEEALAAPTEAKCAWCDSTGTYITIRKGFPTVHTCCRHRDFVDRRSG